MPGNDRASRAFLSDTEEKEGVMKRSLSVSLLALAMSACASASQTLPREAAGPAPQNQGAVTVAGLSASQALGAVDTARLVGSKPEGVTANQPVDRSVSAGAPSEGAIAVEGVPPASVLAAIDTTKLVGSASSRTSLAPEVQAAAGKKGYTTQQLAMAQLEAVRKQ